MDLSICGNSVVLSLCYVPHKLMRKLKLYEKKKIHFLIHKTERNGSLCITKNLWKWGKRKLNRTPRKLESDPDERVIDLMTAENKAETKSKNISIATLCLHFVLLPHESNEHPMVCLTEIRCMCVYVSVCSFGV